eukprot:RCo004279
MTSRIIIVSNRLPVTVHHDANGNLAFSPSAGGLATGLSSLSMDRLWIGWPGMTADNPEEQIAITQQLALQRMAPVFLTEKDVSQFYDGFSNKTIWPHFHYFTQYTAYNDEFWDSYSNVNRLFAEVIADEVQPTDIVWVHDYQLMLVPGLLRATFPTLSVGFFLHIPFPSYEVFRTLPWRLPILQGILGADMIGFHTFDYMRHFLSSVYRIVGYEHSFGRLEINGRCVKVDALPMGIDYAKFAEYQSKDSSQEVRSIREISEKRKLILSVDRLDYTKGIPERIKAYESFLRTRKEYIGKVSLVLVVVPSRTAVGTYSHLKEEIDVLVGAVNGDLGTFDWVPIHYFYRPLAFETLSALYQLSHIAMITPLRDGMNLVAKEFVASKDKCKSGVLILSEMAGAAGELEDALIINPCDMKNIAQTLAAALEMPEAEQAARMTRMQRILQRNDVKAWAKCFIEAQVELQSDQQQRATYMLVGKKRRRLLSDFESAPSRLLLLDVGGTLTQTRRDPRDAHPDLEMLSTLKQILELPNTTVVLLSGRDRQTMEEWFGSLGVDMIAEHGAFLYTRGKWSLLREGMDSRWKEDFRPILEKLVTRTPGSYLEEKECTLAWHYSTVERRLGQNHLREIREQLTMYSANHMTTVVEGQDVVEIHLADVNKGKASMNWLVGQGNWGFILAVGDDLTDEPVFEAVPEGPTFYTVKVGMGDTRAHSKIPSVGEFRSLLRLLATRDVQYLYFKNDHVSPLTPASPYSLPLPLKYQPRGGASLRPDSLQPVKDTFEEKLSKSKSSPTMTPTLTDLELSDAAEDE